MKCLDVIFIRILIKGYLKNISENEIVNFECKCIKNKNKVTYVDNDVRFNIKINDDNVMLIRDGADFINTFIFDKNKKNSISNYLIKENNCDVDIDIDVIDLKIDDDIIYIKYLISETNCIYEYKLEMRDVL